MDRLTPESRVLTTLKDGHWHTLSGLAWGLEIPRRTAEEAIESLRLSGEPIIGGNDGVRYTTDPALIRDYVRRRRARTLTVAMGTRRMAQTAARLEALAQGFDPDRPRLWDAAA